MCIRDRCKTTQETLSKNRMGRKPIVERKCQAGRRVGERSNIKMATENIFTKYEKLNRAEVIVNILNE